MNIDVEALLEGEEYLIDDFKISADGVFVREKYYEENYKKLCNLIFIKKSVQNIDTNDIDVELGYKFKGKYKSLKVSLDMINPRKLKELLAKGIIIPPGKEKEISEYLLKTLELVESEYIYKKVGWNIGSDGKLQYRLNNIYSNSNVEEAKNSPDNPAFDLKCNGSKEKWLKMCQDEVVGNVELETALCFGFSAVILGYLNVTESLVIHIVGNSTTGKTTASNLAISAFGNPNNISNGISRTWNGTSNALIRSIGGNFGVPLLLDELSMLQSDDLTGQLYAIASGQDKSRLNDKIEQVEKPKWATTIISTGEQNIFKRTTNNVGLRVRVLQFDGIKWTKSAQHADKINDVIRSNYGFVAIDFIKYIFKKGTNIIDEKMDSWKAKCLEHMSDTSFKDRLSYKFAIILTAGDIANEALKLNINLDEVLKFLIETQKNNFADMDMGNKAFDDIVQLIIKNNSKFVYQNQYYSSSCWGKISLNGNYYEVGILKNILEEELYKLKYEDVKIVVRELKKKGHLITEKNKTTKRQVIGKNRENLYVVKVPVELLKSYI